MQILVVKPGTASTKVAVFSDEDLIILMSQSDDAETKPSGIALTAVVAGV